MREASHALVLLGAPASLSSHCCYTAQKGLGEGFCQLILSSSPALKLSSYAKMLICKEIRVGGLEESLSGRVTHQHLQIVNLIETLTLLGAAARG